MYVGGAATGAAQDRQVSPSHFSRVIRRRVQTHPIPNSSMFVLPVRTAPALRSFCTTVASKGERYSAQQIRRRRSAFGQGLLHAQSLPRRVLEAQVVGASSAVANKSLTPTLTPSNAPLCVPDCGCAAASVGSFGSVPAGLPARRIASPRAEYKCVKAFTRGFSSSARAN